jgi:hypothetical protein
LLRVVQQRVGAAMMSSREYLAVFMPDFSDKGFWWLAAVQSKKIDNAFANKNKAVPKSNPLLYKTFTP